MSSLISWWPCDTVPPRMDAFAQREEEQILKQGIRTRLLCGVSQGDKPLDFSWTKDGQPLSDLFGSRGGVNVREVDADSSALTFTNLSAVHSGRYECAASNAAGVARQSTQLFVQGIQKYQNHHHNRKLKKKKKKPIKMACSILIEFFFKY